MKLLPMRRREKHDPDEHLEEDVLSRIVTYSVEEEPEAEAATPLWWLPRDDDDPNSGRRSFLV